MVEKISNEKDFYDFIREREFTSRLRNAISHCKNSLEITVTHDRALKADQKVSFERCLTENYLLKYGKDYFGKRDLIYIDLFGSDDVKAMNTSV